MPKICAVGLTNSGKVRDKNEDCLAIGDWITQQSMLDPVYIETVFPDRFLCVVADGLGGHVAGEIASKMATTRLRDMTASLTDAKSIINSLQSINAVMCDAMQFTPNLSGMGTTIAGVLVLSDRILCFNVGDSRIYLQNHNFFRLISKDDININGFVSTEERTGQRIHSIMQSLGGTAMKSEIVPHIYDIPLQQAERLLICSDGLTDMLDQDAIESCLNESCYKTVQNMFNSAMENGGYDNVSLIYFEVQP